MLSVYSGKDSGEKQQTQDADSRDLQEGSDSDGEDAATKGKPKNKSRKEDKRTEKPGARGKTGRIANYEDDENDDVDDMDMDAYEEEQDDLGDQWSDYVGGDSDNKEAKQSVRDELLDRKSSKKAGNKKKKGRGGR